MRALLDTHALYWAVSEVEQLAEAASIAIAEAQANSSLFVSPVTAWELGASMLKPRREDRPDLGSLTPRVWFRGAVLSMRARVAPIRQRIALEAAEVVATTGHKDPGDCFLIATARVLRAPIITRDRVMCSINRQRPDYLSVIEC